MAQFLDSELKPKITEVSDSYDLGEEVTLDPRETALGVKMYHALGHRFLRQQPYLLDPNGNIFEYKTFRPARGQAKLAEIYPGANLMQKIVRSDGLEKEPISSGLADGIEEGMRVEMLLSDYDEWSRRLYRGNMGMSFLYFWWTREEMPHMLVFRSILEKTGHRTAAQNDAMYMEVQKRKWKPPFKDAREMACYAEHQEENTMLVYLALADQALKEGAPTVAKNIKYPAGDEGLHSTSFGEVVDMFHEDDPDGTKAAMIYVASHYRMPAQGHRTFTRTMIQNLLKIGVINKPMVADRVLYENLIRHNWISHEEARDIADNHWKKPGEKNYKVIPSRIVDRAEQREIQELEDAVEAEKQMSALTPTPDGFRDV